MTYEQKLEYIYEQVEKMSPEEFRDFIVEYLGVEYLFYELKDSLVEEENIDIALDHIKDIVEHRKDQANA